MDHLKVTNPKGKIISRYKCEGCGIILARYNRYHHEKSPKHKFITNMRKQVNSLIEQTQLNSISII